MPEHHQPLHASAQWNLSRLDEEKRAAEHNERRRERQREQHELEMRRVEAERQRQERAASFEVHHDPNAFDATLASFQRMRHTGSDTAALLSFTGM